MMATQLRIYGTFVNWKHPRTPACTELPYEASITIKYVINGLSYQSNYGAGIRVYHVSSIPQDPTWKSVCEIAYFDIYPEDDDELGGGIV